MKVIEYKAVYADPATAPDEIIRVVANDINSGFAKALKLAKEPRGDGSTPELHSVEFWMVK